MDLQNDKVVCKARGKVMLGATILTFLSTIFMLMVVIFGESEDTVLTKVIAVGFVGIIAVITLLHYLNTSVTFYKGTVIHQNLIGKCKEYKLEDLKEDYGLKHGVEMKFKKRKVTICYYYKNSEAALTYLEKWKKQEKSKKESKN